MDYWQERLAASQLALTDKNRKQIEKQLKKYYGAAANRIIEDFERTYEKIESMREQGKEPTPADLYKLDKYWQAQGRLRHELQRLGEREVATMTKIFEINFFDIYYSFSLEGAKPFNTIDVMGARQIINQIWCADGKTWSQRIWDNIELLAETLNEELIHCVSSGKRITDLKNILQERFGVSYNRADALVRTELAHIQTQAAKKRYEDYGLEEYEFLADPDERTCSDCAALDGKRFRYAEMVEGKNAPPIHPNDRCCIVPIIP